MMINDLLIAHRGESFDAPENTMASINLAWERGVKSVEIDIHLTHDNEVVVIHDANTRRVSGINKIVKKSSLKELRDLDFGSYKDKKWHKERIPTLKDVLETVPPYGRLIIEIKSGEKILYKLKAELAQSELKDSQIELIAFNAQTLALAKQMMPEYKMLWLLDLDYFWPHWLICKNIKRIIKKTTKLNLDGVNVWAGKTLNKEFIEGFINSDLLIYSWTVNSPRHARTLIECGIHGITSDRPSWMIKQLENNE